MSTAALTCFQRLKEDVSSTARRTCPENPVDIRAWKGQQIRCFQEDLTQRVNGRISEKWFYTHMKADQDTLPRVDILDLLSRYVGYRNWEDYQRQHLAHHSDTPLKQSRYRPWYAVGVALLLAGLLGFFLRWQRSVAYQFCFVNAYSKRVVARDIEVMILTEGESPYRVPVDSSGCLTVDTRRDQVRLAIRSSYYKNDTLVRTLNKANPSERVALEPDDYAWMIRLFSHAQVSDWQQRRAQLDTMIAANARIYQLFDDQTLGVELYNKQEFINKLTMPLRSLRRLEVLDIRYQGDRIQVLRFKQENDDTP